MPIFSRIQITNGVLPVEKTLRIDYVLTISMRLLNPL